MKERVFRQKSGAAKNVFYQVLTKQWTRNHLYMAKSTHFTNMSLLRQVTLRVESCEVVDVVNSGQFGFPQLGPNFSKQDVRCKITYLSVDPLLSIGLFSLALGVSGKDYSAWGVALAK
jgi:hypothetical protein